jgi:hypothetical protein
VSGVGVGWVARWVTAVVVVVAALVEGEAMVATSTLGMVGVMTFLSRSQWMQSQSVAKLVFASQHLCACVRCRYWLNNIIVLEYTCTRTCTFRRLKHCNIAILQYCNTATHTCNIAILQY